MPTLYRSERMDVILSVFALLILYGCSSSERKQCIKKEIVGHTFKYFSADQPKGHFVMSDSIYSEFIEGKLYAKSKVIWQDCKEYLLVPKEITYDKGLKIGDTLRVKILSLNNDTLTCAASAYGQSYEFKVLRSN